MAVRTRLTQRFWLAFGLLTRLPLPRVAAADPAGSAAFFPWVGLAVGALGAAAWYLLYRPLGAWLAGAAVLAVGVLVTGGLHQDGSRNAAAGERRREIGRQEVAVDRGERGRQPAIVAARQEPEMLMGVDASHSFSAGGKITPFFRIRLP